jgi:serine/threonine protein phosphatase PrpC
MKKFLLIFFVFAGLPRLEAAERGWSVGRILSFNPQVFLATKSFWFKGLSVFAAASLVGVAGWHLLKYWNHYKMRNSRYGKLIGNTAVELSQGLCPFMEDMHKAVATKSYGFFGVYDGHGGRGCAENLQQNLHVTFGKLHDKDSDKYKGAIINIAEMLEATFVETDFALTEARRKRNQKEKGLIDKSGSCAVVAVVKDNRVYVANAGDSRAVLCENGKAIDLSHDHKPDPGSPEGERIRKIAVQRGITEVLSYEGCWRVRGILAMGRAFGHGADEELSPYITAKPEIEEAQLTGETEFLILASDGLWDQMSSENAVAIVKDSLKKHPSNFSSAAQELMREVFKKEARDNVTVIVVDLASYFKSLKAGE